MSSLRETHCCHAVAIATTTAAATAAAVASSASGGSGDQFHLLRRQSARRPHGSVSERASQGARGDPVVEVGSQVLYSYVITTLDSTSLVRRHYVIAYYHGLEFLPHSQNKLRHMSPPTYHSPTLLTSQAGTVSPTLLAKGRYRAHGAAALPLRAAAALPRPQFSGRSRPCTTRLWRRSTSTGASLSPYPIFLILTL